jgi:hypothetical protein
LSTYPGTARALTGGEIALAAEIFGPAIDYARVRVHHRRWWPLQPANVCMSPDGDLWFGRTSPLWREDFAKASLGLQGLFVHEMTHVWQAQQGGRWFLPMIRHPFCRYRYQPVPGKPFRRYGIEQQAEIVRHVFLVRRGITGVPDLSALLPFADVR